MMKQVRQYRSARVRCTVATLALLSAASPLFAQHTRDSTQLISTLGRLRERVTTTSPALAIALANRDRALALARATGHASPLTFSAGLSEAPISAVDQGNLRAEFSRDFRTGSRRIAERALADVEVRLADVEVDIATRHAQADAMRTALVAAATKRIGLRLSAEDALLRDTESNVRDRFATGDARYVDVLRLRTERLHVQSDRSLVAADEQSESAELRAMFTGQFSAGIQEEIDSIAGLPLEELWRAVLPTIAGAGAIDSIRAATATEQRLAIDELRANAGVNVVTAQQRSQINGYAGIQRIGGATNGPTFGPSIGFTMTLPFTANRANDLALQAANVAVNSTRTIRGLQQATTRLRIEAAIARYTSARRRLELFDATLLRGAREERESALAAYRTGDFALIELLDFERAMSRAEVERLRALIDAIEAFAALSQDDDATSQPLNARSAR